jgi:hypothetical protein
MIFAAVRAAAQVRVIAGSLGAIDLISGITIERSSLNVTARLQIDRVHLSNGHAASASVSTSRQSCLTK